MKRWYRDEKFLTGLAVTAGLMAFFNRKQISSAIRDVVHRGGKATKGQYDERLGIVVTDPEILREMATMKMGRNVTRDALAAGRMIRSEGAAEGALRVHVALNDLKKFPYASTLYDLLTYSTDSQRRGYYGKQYSPAVPPGYPKANKRRYATRQDAYTGDILVAEQAIADWHAGRDMARGATKFIDKSHMGKQLGSVSFAQKDAEWRNDGYQPFTIAEYGQDLVLYRKA